MFCSELVDCDRVGCLDFFNGGFGLCTKCLKFSGVLFPGLMLNIPLILF